MLTNTQINDFINEVTTAYNKAAHLITEDTIRSLLIKAMKVPVSDIEIEVPYVVNPGRKTNGKKNYTPIKALKPTWFNSERNRADIYYSTDDMVIEVKYHRETPYSANCTTSKIGAVFNDFNRLSVIHNKEKLLVYVFDNAMKKYFDKSSRKFTDILKGNAQNQTYTIDKAYDSIPQDAKNNAFRSFAVNSFGAFHAYQVKGLFYKTYSVNGHQFTCAIVQVL